MSISSATPPPGNEPTDDGLDDLYCRQSRRLKITAVALAALGLMVLIASIVCTISVSIVAGPVGIVAGIGLLGLGIF